MVSTVFAISLPVLLIELVNYYTCKKWLLTKTVDSSISCVDSRDRSIAQVGKLVLPASWRKGSKVYRKVQILFLPSAGITFYFWSPGSLVR